MPWRQDASCTQLVTAMSDQLMKRYCRWNPVVPTGNGDISVEKVSWMDNIGIMWNIMGI